MLQKILITSLLLSGCLPFDPVGSVTLNLTDVELTETRGEPVSRGDETIGESSSLSVTSEIPTTGIMESTSLPTEKWDLGDDPTSSTTGIPVPQECGNRIVEGTEDCDGLNIKEGLSCETLGWEGGGFLSCNLEDCTINHDHCSNVKCPNYVLDENEECEPFLYGFPGTTACFINNDDFGKCTITFFGGLYYSGLSINNGQMQTPELDQEEADIFCKIYLRNLDAFAEAWDQDTKGWDNNRDYLSDSDLGLGLDKVYLLYSTKILLGDFDLYYIPREYIDVEALGLDPDHPQFRFICGV